MTEGGELFVWLIVIVVIGLCLVIIEPESYYQINNGFFKHHMIIII